MALIADKIILNPKATASAPSGSEGSLYYDSDKEALMSYGASWQMVSRTTATGGTITTYTGFKVHTFLSDGTFSISGGSITCDILIVAGGGGGGQDGGAGGAGGMVVHTDYIITPGSYTVTVGAGGQRGIPASQGSTAGENSSIAVAGTTTAVGGGKGANEQLNSPLSSGVGGAGGSGGSGAYSNQTGGAGTAGQGNAGGYGSNSSPYPSGGGGGAGAAGANNNGGTGGAGGVGLQNAFRTGDNQYYSGGGGGSSNSANQQGAGGLGGGGAGGGGSSNNPVPIAGTANTGGGGGAGSENAGAGAAGGSGIVVVRYAD